MGLFLKGIALLIAVTCFVWVAVLWQWDRTHRAMAVQDVVVYLGLLPLAVFVLLVGFRWALLRAHAAQVARAAAASLAPAAQAGAAERSASTPGSGSEPRRLQWLLLDAQVLSAAGQASDEVIAAAGAGTPRPKLDALLRDDDGLPVMTARLPLEEQAEDAVRAELEALAPSGPADRPLPATRVLRTLAALRSPLLDAMAALAPWHAQLGVQGVQPDRASTALQPSTPADFGFGAARAAAFSRPPPSLQLLVGWPADWDEDTASWAQGWLTRLVADALPLPAERVHVRAERASGPQLWQAAERRLLAPDGQPSGDLLLVAAAHSDLDEAGLMHLEQSQRLLHASRRPHGIIPGEAAVALLLAPPDWPADPDASEPPARLTRASIARREKSVEASGRVAGDVLTSAMSDALSACAAQAPSIAALACDADQHTPRATELFDLTVEHLGHLDPVEDMTLLATVTGATGAASTLTVIAAAAALARGRKAPALALAQSDPHWRMALLALPPAEPASATPDAPATSPPT